MTERKTYIGYVLDESGSMQAVREQTISGFNEFTNSQEDQSLGPCDATLIKFNSDAITEVFSGKPIEDVPELTVSNYQPRSTTPLYDAVAMMISSMESQVRPEIEALKKLAGTDVPPPPIIIVIMTDGVENASRQYSQRQIFDMIQQKKDEGWTFVFLGADQDSWATGGQMGIAAGNTVNFAKDRTFSAFASVGQSMTNYRTHYRSLTADLEKSAVDGTADDTKKIMEEITALRTNYFEGKEEL